MSEIKKILDKFGLLLENDGEKSLEDALPEFTEEVKTYLSKRAERAYRRSGEPWDSRINELEKQFLDSLDIKDNVNWIRYTYEEGNAPRALFYIAKNDSETYSRGDIFYPDSKQRPDVRRQPLGNVFDSDSYRGILF